MKADNTNQYVTQGVLKKELSELEERMKVHTEAVVKTVVEEMAVLINDVMERFDERFARIELRLANLEARMEKVEERLAKIESDIARLYDYVDKVAKRQEIDEQERLVMSHQLTRLEGWAHQLADRANVQLRT